MHVKEAIYSYPEVLYAFSLPWCLALSILLVVVDGGIVVEEDICLLVNRIWHTTGTCTHNTSVGLLQQYMAHNRSMAHKKDLTNKRDMTHQWVNGTLVGLSHKRGIWLTGRIWHPIEIWHTTGCMWGEVAQNRSMTHHRAMAHKREVGADVCQTVYILYTYNQMTTTIHHNNQPYETRWIMSLQSQESNTHSKAFS